MESRKQQCSGYDKALQTISFKDRTEPLDPLYANHKILKIQKNIITLTFVITYQMLSPIISNILKISTDTTQGVPIISPKMYQE